MKIQNSYCKRDQFKNDFLVCITLAYALNSLQRLVLRHKFITATETFEEKSREIIVRNKIVD